jgi:hypothetical protein
MGSYDNTAPQLHPGASARFLMHHCFALQVLFVGQPRFAKERLAEEEDLKKYTKKVRQGCRCLQHV